MRAIAFGCCLFARHERARRLQEFVYGSGVARMDLGITLALVASAFLGTAVVIANLGLRYLDPARGALVSIPSTTAMFWLLALFLFRGEGWNATAFAIFAAVGLIFPALVTFLNFASNRLAGPTVAGTVSSTTPLFAVLGAMLFLSEPFTPAAVKGGLALWPDPFVAALVGYTVSSATIFASNRAFVPRASATLDRRGIFWFMAVGLCNGLGVLAIYAALNRRQVSVVSPLVATYPLFT